MKRKLSFLWFCIRHPLKAFGVLIAAGLGLWILEEVEWGVKWMVWEIQVSSGRTAQAHQIAEGYNV